MNRRLCEICEIRPIMTAVSKRARGTNFPYCDPCQDLAEWENRHSDEAHDSDNDATAEKDACWICHPELDETSKEYKPRAGTSRAGMRMTVRRTMTGREKAALLAERIGEKAATSIATRKGVVTLKAATESGTGFALRWDLAGAYIYVASTATKDGKERKVRNASEALKIIGL